MAATFGFVGLGEMGGPMAANLGRAVSVLGFARSEGARASAREAGIEVADRIEALGDCDRLILCLPDGQTVESVLFGDAGLAPRLTPGAIVVDTSTIEHARTCRIAERLAGRDIGFLDAPVSGMRARAEAGTLTMMCGGDGASLDALRQPFSAMASSIHHMGPVGSGQLAKLVNQLLFDINAAGLAEILPLAAKLGLDPARVGEIVNSGTGRSHASEVFIPHILEGRFDRGYPMQDAYKDLVSGAEIAARHCAPVPVLAAATATYQQALRAGHGRSGKGAMIRVFEDLLDAPFRAQGAS